MNLTDIAPSRLINQQITEAPVSSAKELVSRIGALQAQDYNMVKWALGIRLPGSTKRSIEKAIERGEIIRTHLLRPTWHFVSADDLRWMLELTAPQIKTAIRSRHNQLGLTKEIVSKTNKIIEKAFSETKQLTRKELVDELESAGFENKENRASHLLLRAELDGVICSGPTKGKNYTYALLDERVPKTETPDKDEALARLGRTYFRSHGPATLQDFTWWSGLTKTTARKALEMIEPDFSSEEINSQMYWFPDSSSISKTVGSVYLLPAYDEFIISYKDRSAVITAEHHKKAVSSNGIFRPVIVLNGQVIGIWKRSVKKELVIIETEFFSKPTKKTENLVEKASEKFAAFLGKKLEIKQA